MKNLLLLSLVVFLSACGSSTPTEEIDMEEGVSVEGEVEVSEEGGGTADVDEDSGEASDGEEDVSSESVDSDLEEMFVLEDGIVNWYGSKKVGGGHGGTIAVKSAEVVLTPDNVMAEFIIDMESMESETGGLVDHLKNEDFFNVPVFPISVLKVTETKKTDVPDVVQMTGDLTIKGITNEIVFPALVAESNGKIEASAKFSIDRTLWEIKYGSGKFFDDLGDKVINDMIDFEINVVLAPKS